MMHGYAAMGGWGYLLLTASIFLFLGLAILGGVALFRSLIGSVRQDTTPADRPEQILAERFARGEVDTEEYSDRLFTIQATKSV